MKASCSRARHPPYAEVAYAFARSSSPEIREFELRDFKSSALLRRRRGYGCPRSGFLLLFKFGSLCPCWFDDPLVRLLAALRLPAALLGCPRSGFLPLFRFGSLCLCWSEELR